MSKEFEKLPPQNIEAEEAFLGSLLIDNEAIFKVADKVKSDDFYKDVHGTIYQTILGLWEKREPIDILNVANRLAEKNELEEIGGRSYLVSLTNKVPTSSHIVSYAQIIQKKSSLRKLIKAASEITSSAYQEVEETEKILDKSEQKLFAISQKFIKKNFISIKDVLGEAYERINELSKGEKGLVGVPTGFIDLDNLLGCLQPSDLILLAARPSVGKCVVGDTEIISPNPGSISTIEEVVKNKKKKILTMDDNFRIIETQASDFIDNGRRPVFRVRTALGKEIETTITHPFLTIDGWKPLKDLSNQDRIAVVRKIPVFGKNSLPNYQVKALAYFITEGGLTSRSPIFTTSNKKIAREFIQSIQKFPKVKVKEKKVKNGKIFLYRVSGIRQNVIKSLKILAKKIKIIVKKSKIIQKDLTKRTNLSFATISAFLNGHCLPLKRNFVKILTELSLADNLQRDLLKDYDRLSFRNSVTEWLWSLGLMGKLSVEKFIPEVVFTFTKTKLALFLNRLFSCDGSIYQRKRDKTYHISYSSSSKRLIRQVQHLLLRFGIVSKIRKKKINYKKGIKLAYEIEIHNSENISAFIKEIGFYRAEEKSVRIKGKLTKIRKGWTQDTLPLGIWKKILKIKGERTWCSVYQELGLPKTYNIHAFRRQPRRETIDKLGEVLHSPLLKNFAQSDIYWDRIVEIKYMGKKQVYDLVIPETHNFIANDFIVHNSSLALDIARNAAVYYKMPVGVFSLEMSTNQVIERLIAAQSGVDLWQLKTGKLSHKEDGDFKKINQALSLLAEAQIFIDDSPIISVNEIRTKARRLQLEHHISLLIIDYLQLMESSSSYKNRLEEVTEISRYLKALARELDIPVLAISQLSRAPEARTPAIPRLSDLRDSGTLEQDSDIVLFIYRKFMDRGIKNCPEEEKNITEVHIAKHRHGPTGGIVKLYFDDRIASFKNLEKDKYPENELEGANPF